MIPTDLGGDHQNQEIKNTATVVNCDATDLQTRLCLIPTVVSVTTGPNIDASSPHSTGYWISFYKKKELN